MDFCHFLTSYMPDTAVGSKTHFQNMIDQSILADKLGYKTVSIPEHHLINILMMPSPLQMAVKIANKSSQTVKIGKKAFYNQAEMNITDAYRYSSQIMIENMMNKDSEEGIEAFLEKRTPNWS